MADEVPGLTLTPNQAQQMVLVRELVKIVGMVLVTTGWLTQEQAGVLMQGLIMGSGALLMIAPIVIQLYKTTRKQQIETVKQLAQTPSTVTVDAKTALITATAMLPEVKKVDLDKDAPHVGTLNAATPPNVVAS